LTELSFLIELLLNHDLPKPTKDLIASRIKDVEMRLHYQPQQAMKVTWQGPNTNTPMPQQAPSTLALMAKHGDIPAVNPAPEMPPIEPVAVIAQTPATAAALNSRNEAIAASINGKVDKVTGRPRKW
jgi:hypothetical protein